METSETESVSWSRKWRSVGDPGWWPSSQLRVNPTLRRHSLGRSQNVTGTVSQILRRNFPGIVDLQTSQFFEQNSRTVDLGYRHIRVWEGQEENTPFSRALHGSDYNEVKQLCPICKKCVSTWKTCRDFCVTGKVVGGLVVGLPHVERNAHQRQWARWVSTAQPHTGGNIWWITGVWRLKAGWGGLETLGRD